MGEELDTLQIISRKLYFTMSLSRCFSLLGDSNVQRHMNPTNCRDRPLISGCQTLQVGRFSMFAETLRSVRAESSVVIVACLSNFLSKTSDEPSVAFRVEPVFLGALEVLNAHAALDPNRFFIVSPPMYRRSPVWYRDGMPEILTRFSSVFQARAPIVLLVSSFKTPEFEGDGVHLTAYSGLEYVLHLFDSAVQALDGLESPVEVVAAQSVEAVRVLEDRMVAIEQDHRRLVQAFDSKFAEDSELHDFQENTRFEPWLILEGPARLPSGLSGQEWQERAKADCQEVLKILMGSEQPIVFIQNATRKAKDAPAGYSVQLPSAELSKKIRTKFGLFFHGGGDKRPDALKHVSIRARFTLATPVRVAILKVFAQRYLDSNPGAKVQVINYDPRPLLKLTPPASESDRRVMTHNFIQAVRLLPANFTQEEIDSILKRVHPSLHGKLRQTFVVISDDMVKKNFQKPASAKASQAAATGESTSGSTTAGKTATGPRGNKRGNPSPDERSGKHKK